MENEEFEGQSYVVQVKGWITHLDDRGPVLLDYSAREGEGRFRSWRRLHQLAVL